MTWRRHQQIWRLIGKLTDKARRSELWSLLALDYSGNFTTSRFDDR